ncbi:two-component response regulator ARR14-like [Bidens hawaiensis]|uniref:two-component response regulator ARR14-like n=1 Tax=Bidens hawaiensis TaxID=980011 RepID=UPI0040490CD8
MAGSSSSLKFTGAGNGNELPNNFPEGVRVLVVDDDPTCLMIIDKKLKKCNYTVTLCNKAETAIALLRENKNTCDIVLSDVRMPGMDGFKLLQLIGLEIDIPVILMSADDSPSVMMKGIDQGACDYIIKPVSIEVLRSIWLHVVRSRKPKSQCQGERQLALVVHEEANQPQQLIEYAGCTSPENERRKGKMVKRRKDREDEYEDPDESSSSKKPRVVWTLELHQKFVEAVNLLGLERAVPKKILELMGVPGITRENIASHLQKYRLYLKRMKNMKHPRDIDAAFMDFLSRGYELQGLTGRGQFSNQPLPPFQTNSLIDRLSNSRSLAPMSGTGQRIRFLFEDPRFLVNPPNAEQKQYLVMNSTPSHQYSFNGVNSQALVPMPDPSHGQNLFSNGMLANGLGSNVSGSGIGPGYNCYGSNQIQMNIDPVPQNMTFTDWMTYPTSPTMGLPSTSFALEGTGTLGDNSGDNQPDLLSSLLDQTMEGVGPMGTGLEFDGYDFDDLP